MQQRRQKPNARKRAHVPARRSRPMIPTIDIHAHFVPEEYLRLIEAEGEPHGVRLRPGPNGPTDRRRSGCNRPHHRALPRSGSTAESNGRGRVAVHALSLMPPMVYWADGCSRFASSPGSSTTRWRKPPGRIPTASSAWRPLPLQDPEAARHRGGAGRHRTRLPRHLSWHERSGKELTDPVVLPGLRAVFML